MLQHGVLVRRNPVVLAFTFRLANENTPLIRIPDTCQDNSPPMSLQLLRPQLLAILQKQAEVLRPAELPDQSG